MADITPLRGEGRTVGRITGLWGECLAEFFGTFVLLCFGDGVVAVVVAALPGSGRTASPTTIWAPTNWLVITFGWAFAVCMAVYVAGGVSGAHINPAVTVALAVRRKFPWRSVGPYVIAQVVGAFVGAALVFLVFHQAINAWNLANHTPKSAGNAFVTNSIFNTFPAPYYGGSQFWPLISEIVGTAFLLIFVVAITDSRNQLPGANLPPLLIGFAVFAVGTSFGPNTGYAINPARDFGPRIFAWIAGWGKVAMPGNYLTDSGAVIKDYFWVPIVGPLLGAALAAVVYDLGIRDFLKARMGPEPGVHGVGEVVQDVRPPAPDR